jgi:hypothetical protein
MEPGSKPGLPAAVNWPEATVEWFDAWRSSPRTDGWDEAQWRYMFDTALVHAHLWESGNLAMTGELRLRLAALGLAFGPQKAPTQIINNEKVTPLDEIRKRRERRGGPARRSGAAT